MKFPFPHIAAAMALSITGFMPTVSQAQPSAEPSRVHPGKNDREPETLDEFVRRNRGKGTENTPKPKPEKGLTVETVHKNWFPITMKPGLKEGVRLHQIFLLYEADKNGNKHVIGKAWVAKVGPGYVAGGEGSSKADIEQTVLIVYEHTQMPTRGTMLEETGEFFDPAHPPR